MKRLKFAGRYRFPPTLVTVAHHMGGTIGIVTDPFHLKNSPDIGRHGTGNDIE
jgi:hypothetical protein